MIYKIFVKQTILFIINFYQRHFACIYIYIVSKMKNSYSVNTSLVTYQILHTKSKSIVSRN